jgi:serine/threonine-protein kinase PpkA
MEKPYNVIIAAVIVLFLLLTHAEASGPDRLGKDIECGGFEVCREIATGLPFRILPRSFSNVYKSKEAKPDNIARSNVRAFWPLYVFEYEGLDFSDPAAPQGWYQVSETEQGPSLGWMTARDVLEWRQALVVSYTHPGFGGEERQRVLMFRSKKDLETIIDSQDMVGKAVEIYKGLYRGDIAGSLISKEPELFVDINRTFYLLPILDFEIIEIEGDETRLLQLAAAMPGQRGADTFENQDYRTKAMKKPRPDDQGVKELGIDIVFAMDMTQSMQPYLDRTKKAIAEIARRIALSTVKQKIRFGLVGYRDDVSKTPQLEFTCKNYTPELVDMETFIDTLDKKASVAKVSSIGYPEEVFAGVESGLASNWSEDSLHCMILVGDSSSHPVGHPQNTTGKDETMLRNFAQDMQVHIMAIHLQDPHHRGDHALARAQYSILSKIRGAQGRSALTEIDIGEIDTFQSSVEAIVKDFFDIILQVQSGDLSILTTHAYSSDNDDDVPNPVISAKQATRDIASAGLVEYLGREVNPPKDIVVWTLDRDLTNPALRTLDVRVLINKRHLSELIVSLKQVLTAMDRAQMSQIQFFDALQNISGQTMKNPEAISQFKTVAESGLLPAFLKSLPYRSEILSLTAEMYASMTAEQRAALQRSLRAKLQQYRDINEQVDGWVKLNDTDPDIFKEYPLQLDNLP